MFVVGQRVACNLKPGLQYPGVISSSSGDQSEVYLDQFRKNHTKIKVKNKDITPIEDIQDFDRPFGISKLHIFKNEEWINFIKSKDMISHFGSQYILGLWLYCNHISPIKVNNPKKIKLSRTKSKLGSLSSLSATDYILYMNNGYSISRYEVLSTVAHEYIHALQYKKFGPKIPDDEAHGPSFEMYARELSEKLGVVILAKADTMDRKAYAPKVTVSSKYYYYIVMSIPNQTVVGTYLREKQLESIYTSKLSVKQKIDQFGAWLSSNHPYNTIKIYRALDAGPANFLKNLSLTKLTEQSRISSWVRFQETALEQVKKDSVLVYTSGER